MMSTDEIAGELHLSVNTVKTHLRSIYRKLCVNRRRDAVERGRDLGPVTCEAASCGPVTSRG